MRTNIKPENRRLLEAVEYIDENIILGVLSELRMPTDEITAKKHTGFAHAKHIALIAACALILGAAIPVVSYVLPKLGAVIGGNAGAGESSAELSGHTYTEGDFTFITPYGEVPEEFKSIVEQNLFLNVHVFGDKLVRSYTDYNNGKNVFEIINYSGEQIGEVIFARNDYGNLSYAYPTQDGNILAVFGGGPIYEEPTKPYYHPTRLVKFDTAGNILAVQTLEDISTGCFKYGFQTEDGFIFVGSYTKNIDTKSFKGSNISILEIGHDLKLGKSLTLGEENYHNNLHFAKYDQDKLSVYIRSLIETESYDREEDYRIYNYDTNLNPLGNCATDKANIPRKIDTFDKYYESANLRRAHYYELIEYEDFDLLVADCGTGNYELSFSSSYIDPLSQYSETVYAAYSKDGDLIWRIGIDSTDYEILDRVTQDYEKYQ